MTVVKFKRLKNDAIVPSKSTKGAACYDCYLPETYPPLEPREIRIVDLGFSVEVPVNYELQVRARSGLASKGIIVANGVGCVDSDYDKSVGVILWNSSGAIQPLNRGDRICQVKLSPAPEILWEVVDEVSETDRGEGGFGSSLGHDSLNK